MIDHKTVKPGDRFRVTYKIAPTDDLGKEIAVASITPGIFSFYATDGLCYAWSQVEPITEPEPSLFTPEQLAELDARYGRKDA